MARKMEVVRNLEIIKELLSDKSQFINNYISKSSSEFILYYKYLTHSDLPTFGKATRINRLEKNLLYYITVNEMEETERRENRNFETAHQSNIGLPTSFWDDIGMVNPRINVQDPNASKCLNDFANVYFVNDSMKYFNSIYTIKVFDVLEKDYNNRWTKDINVNLSSDDLTEVKLTQAVHGIGISADTEFHKFRHHLFKNDILFLLIEKNNEGTNLFIIPYKNPVFFTIIGESNVIWQKYKIEEQRRLQSLIIREEALIEEDKQYRVHQDKWRKMLAEEMMNFTTNDNEVFCPLTWISADFNNVGTLFRASHIKSYSTSTEEEKYDINNGLLLISNADALFDKHYITINENKELEFSFLIRHERRLINQLLLSHSIFKEILNDKRMEYLKVHRKIFNQKELERRS